MIFAAGETGVRKRCSVDKTGCFAREGKLLLTESKNGAGSAPFSFTVVRQPNDSFLLDIFYLRNQNR